MQFIYINVSGLHTGKVIQRFNENENTIFKHILNTCKITN